MRRRSSMPCRFSPPPAMTAPRASGERRADRRAPGVAHSPIDRKEKQVTPRAGPYVAFAGLLAAVLAGAPAVALLATFGRERNWVFDARDDAFRLAAVASLGLVALAVGLAVAAQREGRPGRLAASLSLACAAAAALWLLLCLALAAATSSQFAGLPLALGARAAAAGVCALSALGCALGVAALGGGRRGAAALALNATALLGAGVALA